MRDFMLEASISMEGNAMETSDVYTQVFQSLMPLIQIAIVLWAAETILTMLIKRASQVQEEERTGETPP